MDADVEVARLAPSINCAALVAFVRTHGHGRAYM